MSTSHSKLHVFDSRSQGRPGEKTKGLASRNKGLGGDMCRAATCGEVSRPTQASCSHSSRVEGLHQGNWDYGRRDQLSALLPCSKMMLDRGDHPR